MQVAIEQRQLVVAEGARGEGDLLGLFNHGAVDGRVAMTLVDGRVGGEKIEVAPAFDVGDPGTFAALQHHVERVIVVRAKALFEFDEVDFRAYHDTPHVQHIVQHIA